MRNFINYIFINKIEKKFNILNRFLNENITYKKHIIEQNKYLKNKINKNVTQTGYGNDYYYIEIRIYRH